jgi:hypothetical protein
MIGQYLPNNNETVTVTFRQKFCQLNSPDCNCNQPIRYAVHPIDRGSVAVLALRTVQVRANNWSWNLHHYAVQL